MPLLSRLPLPLRELLAAVLLLSLLCASPATFAVPVAFAEPVAASRAEPVAAHISNDLITNGGYAVTKNGRVLEAKNIDTAFVPASTIKLVTCLAALETLGPDYRFDTVFYLQDDILFIRGSGDPTLTSETVEAIATELARLGLKRLEGIVLDDSLFFLSGKADGAENTANAYDTANGALAVNYNAVPVAVTGDGRIASSEEETPLLPIMREIGKKLEPGSHRVNPGALLATGRISPTLRYAGELFKAMLERQGIRVAGHVAAAAVPIGLPPFYTHSSEKTVEEMVRSCLYYSNNFIANQLFLAAGSSSLGQPATWDKGRRAMRAYIAASWPQHRKDIVMAEGSGLSRQTRITPKAMLAILDSFSPYAGLLKTRDGIPLKTGTLAGVHCYAGYLGNGEHPDPFVILLNQPDNTRDRLLARLQQIHAAAH